MISHIEQVLGYFNPTNNFDIDYCTGNDLTIKLTRNISTEVAFGNSLFLFQDLIVSSILVGNSIRIYDISAKRKFDFDFQGVWESPTIFPLFSIRLPFYPKCNCCLYFEEESSLLSISVLSHDGLFYRMDVVVFSSHGKYVLKLVSTFCFEIGISNVLCITQASNKLFLLGVEYGILGLTVCQGTSNNEAPIYSIAKVKYSEGLIVSSIAIIKKTIDSRNNCCTSLITFCGNNKKIYLFEAYIPDNNLYSETSHNLVDSLSIISDNNFDLPSKVCFLNEISTCALLLGDAIHFIYLENFNSKVPEKVRLIHVFTYNFSSEYGVNNNSTLFNCEIHAVRSDIYFSRLIRCNESDEYFNKDLFPLYELYKLRIKFDPRYYLKKFDGFSVNSTQIWNNAFHSLWEEANGNYLSLQVNEKTINTSVLLDHFKAVLYKVCPSNLIFELALEKYKLFIIKNFGDKLDDELITKLGSVNTVDNILNFIFLASKFINNSVETNNSEVIMTYGTFYSEYSLFRTFLLHIYWIIGATSYCIHIFSDDENTFILSPTSFSVVSELGECKSEFILNGQKKFLFLEMSRKPLEIMLNNNYLIIKFIRYNTSRVFFKENLKKIIQLQIGGINSVYSLEVLSTLFGVLNNIKESYKIKEDLLRELIKLSRGDLRLDNEKNTDLEVNIVHCTRMLDNIFSSSCTPQYLEDVLTETINELSSANGFFCFTDIERILRDIESLLGERHLIMEELSYINVDSSKKGFNSVTIFDVVGINKIRRLLKFYSAFLFNLCNFLIWITYNRRTEIKLNDQKIDDIIPISSIFVNLPIFYIEKYISTKKNPILFGGGPQGILNESFGNQFHVSIEALLQKTVQIKSICQFLCNISLRNFASILFSGKLLNTTWEFFMFNTYKFVIQNCGEGSTETLNLLIKYLYTQIFDEFKELDEKKYHYYFYYVNLLFYRGTIEENSLIIIDKLFDNINLVERMLEIIKLEIFEDYKKIICLFPQEEMPKTLVLQLSLIKLNEKSSVKISKNQFYVYLIGKIIASISNQIRLIPESKTNLIDYFKAYVVQLIYLYRNKEIAELIEIIRDSLDLFVTEFERSLLLITLWICFYCLSEFKCEKKEQRFREISCILSSRKDILKFYSSLISLFWVDDDLNNINSKNNVFSEMFNNKSSLLRNNAYKFLIRVWCKENKVKDIIILSFLNLLKIYCGIISGSFKGKLFCHEWINGCQRCNELLCDTSYINTKKVLEEILVYLNPIISGTRKSHKNILFTDLIDNITFSLTIYIRNYYKLFCFDSINSVIQEDKPFCISRDYYCIKLPLISLKEESVESNPSVTYLPSLQYIFYLRWHILSISKLTSGDIQNFQVAKIHFDHDVMKTIHFFEDIISKNGIFLGIDSFEYKLCKENKPSFILLSTMELIYYLVNNGYCSTAFRLIEILSRFREKYEDVNFYYSGRNKNEYGLTLRETIPLELLPNLCKTLAFWTFIYCSSLILNQRQLDLVSEFTNIRVGDKTLSKKRRLEKPKSYKLNELIDELFLQNSNIRGNSFGVNVNIWNIVTEHLYSSPFYFEGICLGLLLFKNIIYNKRNNSIEDIPLNFVLPFDLMNLYIKPEDIIHKKYYFNKFNNHSLNSLISIIENYAYFSQFETALNIIEGLISRNVKFQIPITILIKLRYLVNSSDFISKLEISNRIDNLIINGASGALY
ncbi:hypothetical protein FG386_000281 [Cryptosporidium ryanae]|uniref:uncharacterized protein n=1 Tax=Cryptosporidium ryanae TaxID=515981 RepID=UPI00351A8A65|nr:hypothetical protein FG386_000281 [Cryptosporidium ryanae]